MFQIPSYSYLEDYLSVIKERMAIGVVYSPGSDEQNSVVEKTFNPRPAKSYKDTAEQIASTLQKNGFKIVEIVAEGPELHQAIAKRRFNLFWLCSAGIQGRGSISQASSILESQGFPYIGHTPIQSTLLDDKVLMKQWLRGVGVATAPFIVRHKFGKNMISNQDSDFAREFGTTFNGPFLVRSAVGPANESTTIIEDLHELQSAVTMTASLFEDRVIVEPLLSAQEYCVWGSRGLVIRNNKLVSKQETLTFGHSEHSVLSKKKLSLVENKTTPNKDPYKLLGSTDDTLRADLSFLARAVVKGLGLFMPVGLELSLGMGRLFSILDINPLPDLKRPENGTNGLLSVALEDLICSYDDFILKILVDWLDYHLSVSPSSLAMLFPIFDRYAPQAEQTADAMYMKQ